MKRRSFLAGLALLAIGLTVGLAYWQKRPSVLASSSTQAPAASAASVLPPPSAVRVVTPSSCPRFDKGREVGRVKNLDLTEASGVVVSRQNPGVIWSHNDTSRRPRLFAMLLDGTDLGNYVLDDVEPVDWEDIAIAKATQGTGWDLYIGDIGNNSTSRSEITVYRAREPKVERDQKAKRRRLRNVERFSFAYPNSESHDAETLVVDPVSRDVYVVTKTRTETASLFRAKAPLISGRTTVLEELAAPKGADDTPNRASLFTGGDVSDDGSMVVVRMYKNALLWQRRGDESLASSLERAPCPLQLRREEQGESIAFMADGSGCVTLSEGKNPRILFYERKMED